MSSTPSTSSNIPIPNLPNLDRITDRTTHDAAINLAQGTADHDYTNGQPILIFVTSPSNPICQASIGNVFNLAHDNPQLNVYVMELNNQTSPMIKFGLQNTPIFIFMRGKWCETVLGADWKKVKALVEEKCAKD